MAEHKLMERLMRRRGARWLPHWPPRLMWALFIFVNGFVAVGLLAALAVVCQTAFVFPSVGPTAFLLYYMPTAPTASPRNTLCGHAIGILCGYAALWLMGLQYAPVAILEHIHWPRVLAAALSLSATGALMILLGVVHPPAGATTLIVSLGFITAPLQLCVIMIAMAVMTLQALAVHRLLGVAYPFWSSHVSAHHGSP
jgi:CBS-domain-containing membrane protein